MTKLSPAAQAVRDAYHQEAIDYIEDWGTFRHKRGLAAALRAAADQLVLVQWNGRIDPSALHSLGVNFSRDALHALANELEAQ